MNGHGALTWVALGASASTLLTAPLYYWKGVRDGRRAALDRVWREMQKRRQEYR
jgi:hypothetical protein